MKDLSLQDISQKCTTEGRSLIERLIEGNKRFIGGFQSRFHQNRETLLEVCNNQDPEIIVVTCSDSRNDPAIIFDLGIGDIFEIETAGGIVLSKQQQELNSPSLQLASIEYMVKHWMEIERPGLLLVLGHTNCGAIKVALEENIQKDLSPSLESLIDSVRANLDKVADVCLEQRSRLATIDNSRAILSSIIEYSPLIAKAIERNLLSYTTALFDLETGIVEFPDLIN